MLSHPGWDFEFLTKPILPLTQGPGSGMIQFCAASLLATLVLDDDVMDLIREREEAPLMFQACIILLASVLGKMLTEVARQISIAAGT